MESIDVLGDDGGEFAAAFEIDQCAMRRVWLSSDQVRIVFQASLPVGAAALLVLHEVAEWLVVSGLPRRHLGRGSRVSPIQC